MNSLILPLCTVLCLTHCTKKEDQATVYNPRQSVCYSTKTSDTDWYRSGKKAPLFEGLEGVSFDITTSSKDAVKYFNQGLMLAYGFNHAEAARSFYEASRLDPSCAMAYWGYAYVLGPNYNGGMEDDHYERAFAAVQKAKSLAKNIRPVEAALIEALGKRYQAQPPSDRTPLDAAYVAAMEKVYHQYPSDPDVGALYADAMMNLHPWDLYEKKNKEPKEWTPKLIALLEHLTKIHPQHPGAHHFYIHAAENSATPEKALPSAHLLDGLAKGSGHLLHMPSHIYINTIDYHLGTLSNLRAAETDSVYTTTCHAQGVYPLAYYPHNYHFLAATATLEGNSAIAWMAARKVQQHTAKDLMKQAEWGTLQHYYTIPYYIAAQFGMWDRILAFPEPAKGLVYPKAIRHYARGRAYLGKNDLKKAKEEYATLTALAVDKSLSELTVWNINTMSDLVKISEKVLKAGIAAKENKQDLSVALLKEAAAIEDQLNYNEPPDWFFSVRHHLGAVLLKAGRYADAEKVYREDLQVWKRNGWALTGLYHALKNQKKDTEEFAVKSDFDKAWKYADIKISTSSNIMD